jgi:hypothetical protein
MTDYIKISFITLLDNVDYLIYGDDDKNSCLGN